MLGGVRPGMFRWGEFRQC